MTIVGVIANIGTSVTLIKNGQVNIVHIIKSFYRLLWFQILRSRQSTCSIICDQNAEQWCHKRIEYYTQQISIPTPSCQNSA